ncbi:MAG: hypothetical protein CMF63_07740 [Magnetovibrio sp.]|nr:hypothetical protein [Magnetovibrio sp.]
MRRQGSFGETRRKSWVDRFGIWLSARRIKASVNGVAGKRIADFGCGYHAEIGRSFLDSAGRLVLVDIALAADLKARPNVTAIEGRLPSALREIAGGSLDIIICNSVLEHLWMPLDTLGEIHRLLAPAGQCLLNVPSWRGKWFLEFSAYRLGLSPPEEMDDHKTYYDPKDLWPLLVKANFKPANIRCFKHKFGLNTFAICTKDPLGERGDA